MGWKARRLALALLVTLAVPAALAQEADYRLAAGDVVHIVVAGEAELSGDYRIDHRGLIHFPLISNFEAAGMTLRQLEVLVANKLRPDFLLSPVVSTRLVARSEVKKTAGRGAGSRDLSGDAGQQFRVATQSLRVRREPSSSSAVIGGLTRDDIVTVLYEADGWCDVRLSDQSGRTRLRGWVARRFLRPAD